MVLQTPLHLPSFGWRGQQPPESYRLPLTEKGLEKRRGLWLPKEETLREAAEKIAGEPGFVLFPDVLSAFRKYAAQSLDPQNHWDHHTFWGTAHTFQKNLVEALVLLFKDRFPELLLPEGRDPKAEPLKADDIVNVNTQPELGITECHFPLHQDRPEMTFISFLLSRMKNVQPGTGLSRLVDGREVDTSSDEATTQEALEKLATVVESDPENEFPILIFNNRRLLHGAVPPVIAETDKPASRFLNHVSWFVHQGGKYLSWFTPMRYEDFLASRNQA